MLRRSCMGQGGNAWWGIRQRGGAGNGEFEMWCRLQKRHTQKAQAHQNTTLPTPCPRPRSTIPPNLFVAPSPPCPFAPFTPKPLNSAKFSHLERFNTSWLTRGIVNARWRWRRIRLWSGWWKRRLECWERRWTGRRRRRRRNDGRWKWVNGQVGEY